MNAIAPRPLPAEIAQAENNLFPVFLKLDQLCLTIVGGGAVALEKVKAIISNTSRREIRIIAPQSEDELLLLAASEAGITLHQKHYDISDLEGTDLVICAVNEPALSEQVRSDAHALGLLINVADKPALCDFYLSAVVRKGQLKIAISTNGKSPTLARRLKEILADSIPDEFDDLLQSVNRLRQTLNGDFAHKVRTLDAHTRSLLVDDKRRGRISERFWKKIAYGCVLALFFLISGNALATYISIHDIANGFLYLGSHTPTAFYLMLLTGFLAQLVDGALGMGYGVTCTTVLLAMGIPLPAIGGGIHTAEIFSSGASGFSHYKFGNVNKKLFRIMLIPAVSGSFAGAFILSKWGQEYSGYFKPMLALYTLFLGSKILANAFRSKLVKHKLKHVGWLGFAGGFLDSIGGGGWGPLVTSTLIAKGKSPKYVIGTVSITEFFVTLVSALTFFIMIGVSHWQVITGLIIGGLIAAPVAAGLSGKIPRKAGFISVGLLIIIWSLNIILRLL